MASLTRFERHEYSLNLFHTEGCLTEKPFSHKLLTDFPLIHSVARELDAIAEPQPNVLNLASTIFPFSSTRIWKGIQFFSESGVSCCLQTFSYSYCKNKCYSLIKYKHFFYHLQLRHQ